MTSTATIADFITPISAKSIDAPLESDLPRFFLDIEYLNTRTDDEEGAEFADVQAARHEALLVLCEITANAIRGARPEAPVRVVIRSLAGDTLDTIGVQAILPKGLSS